MNLYSGLPDEARELARRHQGSLDRLPFSFLVNTLVELEKWPALFEPERAYFRALVGELDSMNDGQVKAMFGSLRAFETRTGLDRLEAGDLDAMRSQELDFLREKGEYTHWRREIEAIFTRLGPAVEARLYAGELPTRLVVIIYGDGITIEREKLWKRFRNMSVRVPLDLDGVGTPKSFLAELFTGRPANAEGKRSDAAPAGPTLFHSLSRSGKFTPLDSWIIEAGDDLHTLCQDEPGVTGVEKTALGASEPPPATGMSYTLLRDYRECLSDAIYAKVKSGVRGPVELAAWVKTLEVKPKEGVTLYRDHLVMGFIRDTFLAGNGTIIIDNTFVEWGSVECLKRAQPRLLVARFGVRDKMKPFSSLLLFSKPRPTDQIPIMQDPLGSFIDVELLSYYIWLRSQGSLPYRGRTLYVLLAEGVDEMLAVPPSAGRPGLGRLAGTLPRARLSDVAATLAHWMGASIPGSPGRVIESLLA